MALPVILGDSAELVVLPGSPLAGVLFMPVGKGSTGFEIYNISSHIVITPAVEVPEFFRLPDLYQYYPEVIRQFDTEFVDRPDVPVYTWDSVPAWDEEPFTWDDVIGPEPILQATTRLHQLEFEQSAQEICRLQLLKNLDRVPRTFLPYIAAELGMPLPSASEIAQRTFLKELVRTYKRKGTPLSFFRLFESLGFTLTLQENYQRKSDAAFVNGPQITLISSDLVQNEIIGSTSSSTGPYTFQLLRTPVVPGTLKISVYANSIYTPVVIYDDEDGGWTEGFSGSINYSIGTGSVTLNSSPSLIGQDIRIEYRFFVDPFPDPFGTKWTNRHRSSVVSVALTPKSPSVTLTEEVNDRLLLYLELLKPAHVKVEALDIIFGDEDDEGDNLDEDLNPFAVMHLDSVFGTLYRGMGWSSTVNSAINPNPSFSSIPHRDDNEFQTRWDNLPDPTRGSENPPYHYPFLRNGLFTQPSSANDYESDWFESNDSFDATISNDTSPTTTEFSVPVGSGTTLGVGDHAVIKDGVAGGESRIISSFTDNTTYYTIEVSPAFSVAPQVGDDIVLLQIESPNRVNLEVGYREQDPGRLLFGEELTPAPNGATTGPFTVTIIASHRPLVGTSILRFTIGAVEYEETATGTGAFTNGNSLISSSSINYTTGAVSVTFSSPPDNLSTVLVLSAIGTTDAIGDF